MQHKPTALSNLQGCAMSKVKDLTGQTFNRLTVVATSNRVQKNRPRYLCQCSCGTQLTVDHYHLLSGHTSSCGCAKIDQHTTRLRTHGQSKSSEYKSWVGMKDRCLNPNIKAFKDYGGRGITICDRWLLSFENFLSDMGPKPSPDLTLDRIDVNGNYEPLNCRWLSKPDQNRNTRATVKLTYSGETMSTSEWAVRLCIPQTTLSRWVTKERMTLEQAIERNLNRASPSS